MLQEWEIIRKRFIPVLQIPVLDLSGVVLICLFLSLLENWPAAPLGCSLVQCSGEISPGQTFNPVFVCMWQHYISLRSHQHSTAGSSVNTLFLPQFTGYWGCSVCHLDTAGGLCHNFADTSREIWTHEHLQGWDLLRQRYHILTNISEAGVNHQTCKTEDEFTQVVSC